MRLLFVVIALLAVAFISNQVDAAFTEGLANFVNFVSRGKEEESTGGIVRDPVVLSQALSAQLSAKPFSHHAKEYTFGHKFADKVFAAFGSKLNPLFEKIVVEHFRRNPTAELPKLHISHEMVEMRDGVKLSTIVVVPESARAGGNAVVPTMMSRSPYGPTSDMVALVYTILNGHAAVIQDQRGTFLSEGKFSLWQVDAEDGDDTMKWAASQTWSNGEVFLVGISADGCGALTQMRTYPHKHLKGMTIMYSNPDGHETTFPGGAYREGLITGWMVIQSFLTKGHSFEVTLPEILAHEELDGYWKPIQAVAEGVDHNSNVDYPIIHLAGWADIFQGLQLHAFDNIRAKSNPAVRDDHVLVVGPLGHCIFGSEAHPDLLAEEAKGIINGMSYSSEAFSSVTAKRDFKGHGPYSRVMKRVNLYVQGSARHFIDPPRLGEKRYGHYWTSLDEWPKAKLTKMFVAPSGKLLDAPIPAGQLGAVGQEGFVYDPTNPVITNGGNNFVLVFLGFGCGPHDQSKIESRSDVLVFTSPETIKEPVAIVGKIRAVLHVSSNRNDTDFFVSLNDVHPDGTSYNVVSGLRRMRYHKSTETKTVRSVMKLGEIYEVEIDLWRTAHIFNPGHKIRLTISSSNTPYYAKNDDSGEIGDDAIGMKHKFVAENRVHWAPDAASFVELPIVDIRDIPKNELF